jgi:hypothetical protein
MIHGNRIIINVSHAGILVHGLRDLVRVLDCRAFELSRGQYSACLPCVIDVAAGIVSLR